MTEKQIQDKIAARTAEGEAIVTRFNTEKSRVQKIVDDYNAFAAECHTNVTHLNGCIAELRRLLPAPKVKDKATKKKK